MTTSLAKSRVILSKVERAKKHIEDLNLTPEAYWDNLHNGIRFEDDSQRHERTYYLIRVPEIPLDILNIIGDALHNLRSALDHVAYGLPLTSSNMPSHWQQFPIVESAAKYMSKDVRGKVQLFRQDVVKALDAIKPYKGGNDTLWRLHELNKIDKHRLLLTACLASTHRSMTPSERATIIERFKASMPSQPVPDISRTLTYTQPVPLKAGDKLSTIPHSEMEQQMKFHFEVAFDEPKVIECKPVIEVLHEMARIVGHIVLEFDPMLT